MNLVVAVAGTVHASLERPKFGQEYQRGVGDGHDSVEAVLLAARTHAHAQGHLTRAMAASTTWASRIRSLHQNDPASKTTTSAMP